MADQVMEDFPTVHSELERLLRPLTPDEFDLLEQACVEDGQITDPIVVWDEENLVIDGFNRMRVLEKHPHLEHQFLRISFGNIESVRRWIRQRQAGRRNMQSHALTILRMHLLGGAEEDEAQATVAELADELSTSSRTVQRGREVTRVVRTMPEDIQQRIADGNLTASIKDIQRYDDLDDEQRQAVCGKLRGNAELGLHEAMPARKRADTKAKTTASSLASEKMFSGDTRKQMAWGKVRQPTESETKRLNSLSDVRRQAVDDVLATGGAETVTQALDIIAQASGKKKKPEPDLDRLLEKIEDAFNKTINLVGDLAHTMNRSDSDEHNEIVDALKLARSQSRGLAGVSNA